jgi:hypothetical protein
VPKDDEKAIREQILGQLSEWRNEQREQLERYQSARKTDTQELHGCISDVKHAVTELATDVEVVKFNQENIHEKVDVIHKTMHGDGNPDGGCVAKAHATRRDVDRIWLLVKWVFAALAAAAITILVWWLAAGAPVQ